MNNAIVGQYLPPTLSGIGAFSFGMQGAEGKEHDTDYAGNRRRRAARCNVTNSGTITMSNTGSVPTYGIYAVSQGGEGNTAHEGYAYGGAGNGGAATIVNNGAITNTAPTGDRHRRGCRSAAIPTTTPREAPTTPPPPGMAAPPASP